MGAAAEDAAGVTVMGAMTGAFFCSAAFTSAAEMLAEISVLPFASVLTVPTEPFAVVVVSVTAPVALSVVVVVVEPSGFLVVVEELLLLLFGITGTG